MNKCIKRLVESLFDDDFDDIVNHNDEVTTRVLMEIKLPYCESYLSKQWGDEPVYSETDLDTDTVAFYTKDGRNKKNYLVNVKFLSTNAF